MPGDRQAIRDLEEALAKLQGAAGDDLVRDPVGPAIYRLNPGRYATVIACLSCRHLGLIPSIPKKPRLVWECSGCGHMWALEPPARVWIEGSRPVLIPGRVT